MPSAITHLGLAIALAVLAPLAGRALLRALPRVPSRDRLLALLIGAAALLLRLAAPAATHELRPRNGAGFSPGWGGPWDHGLGQAAFVKVLSGFGALPAHEGWLIAVGPVLSAATVLGLGAWLRLAGATRLAAWTGAGALALWGLDVRYGHTDAPQLLEGALLALGLVLLALPDDLRDTPARLAAGLALGLATTMRPEGLALPLWALPLAVAARRPARSDALVVGVGAVLAVPHGVGLVTEHGVRALELAGVGALPFGPTAFGAAHWAALDPAFAPAAAFGALGLLGLLAGPAPVRVRAAVALSAVVAGALVPFFSSAGGTMSLARHQLRALPWAAALVGLGAGAPLRGGHRVAAGVLAVGVLAATATTLPLAWRPYTLPLEYRLAAEAIRRTPDGCTFVAFLPDQDLALDFPVHLSHQLGRRHDLVLLGDPGLDAALERSPCAIWWRGAGCVTWHPALGPWPGDACADWEAGQVLEPLLVREVPARAWLAERFPSDTVLLGAWHARACAVDPPTVAGR